MLRYTDVITKEIRFVPGGEPIPLRDAFPALRQRLGNRINNYDLLHCSELDKSPARPTASSPRL